MTVSFFGSGMLVGNRSQPMNAVVQINHSERIATFLIVVGNVIGAKALSLTEFFRYWFSDLKDRHGSGFISSTSLSFLLAEPS